MRILFIVVLSSLLFGCSFTYSPVKEVGEGLHQIKTYGNAFSTRDDLIDALKRKASKICGSNEYEFVQDIFIKGDTVYGVGPGYSDINVGTAIATIRCI